MDTDLDALSRNQLLAEVKKLRAGIRYRRSLDEQLPNAPRSQERYSKERG